MDYRLRSVTAADEAWQFMIYASTRADELVLTGWPPEQCQAFTQQQHHAQQQHYRRHFPASSCHLILVDGEIAGRLWLDERADRVHILDIALLPAWRGRGLGTRCLLDLAARDGGRRLSIQVEIHNPARRLYERLGFVADGEPEGLYQAMLRPADARNPHAEECLP
jgi:ribosomal protein S18 acetylase RimI-like enzyme